MKNGKLRSVLSLILLVCGPSVFAQAGSSDNNSFVTILIAVVVLLAFFALIQVSDNLLKLEARQLGVADKIGEVSLLPTWRDLFRSKVPATPKTTRCWRSSGVPTCPLPARRAKRCATPR